MGIVQSSKSLLKCFAVVMITAVLVDQVLTIPHNTNFHSSRQSRRRALRNNRKSKMLDNLEKESYTQSELIDSINDYDQSPLDFMSVDGTDNLEDSATAKIRKSLQLLLELNNGELQSILRGGNLNDIASKLSPSSKMLISGARRKFDEVSESSTLGNMVMKKADLKIAKRKISNNNVRKEAQSLLTAIHELEDILTDTQAEEMSSSFRNKRSGRSRHHYRLFAGDLSEDFHPDFFVKTPCEAARDGSRQLHCPRPDPSTGKWVCIAPRHLCDDQPHCPGGEDELPRNCLYYKAMRDNLEDLSNHLYSLGRNKYA